MQIYTVEVFDDGTEQWKLDGKLHREGAPAVYNPNGYQAWYWHDKRHRPNGPAVVCPVDSEAGMREEEYWLHGKQVTEEEVMSKHNGLTYENRPDGTQMWRDKDGQLHRDDGPSYVTRTGYKAWYRHGQRHRPDGPAIIHADGKTEYYLDGQRVTEETVMSLQVQENLDAADRYVKDSKGLLHCEDGPAVVYGDGTERYYLRGRQVTKEEVMGRPVPEPAKPVVEAFIHERVKQHVRVTVSGEGSFADIQKRVLEGPHLSHAVTMILGTSNRVVVGGPRIVAAESAAEVVKSADRPSPHEFKDARDFAKAIDVAHPSLPPLGAPLYVFINGERYALAAAPEIGKKR